MAGFANGRRSVFLSFVAFVLGGGFARADSIAEFYASHPVTIAIGSDPGGTYDLYARTIARHLGAHIPGSPRVIVQNMPGAGGYTAALHVFSIAPQDGTIIGAIGSALPFQPLMDPNSPKLDVPHINWIGSVSTYDILMLVRADVPVYSVEDLRERQTVMATIAPGQLNSVIVAATNAALGTKIKGVNGHLGMPAAMLALERGEIDGYPSAPIDALKRGYSKQLADGALRLLLQYGPAPSPEFPNVPYALDLAKTPADQALLELAQGPLTVGYAAGPRRPAGSHRRAARRIHGDLRGPGFSRRCETASPQRRAGRRRGNPSAARQGLSDAARCRHADSRPLSGPDEINRRDSSFRTKA
jgi:tripartite-type tricarboxylate transporter receptor subunit TctC